LYFTNGNYGFTILHITQTQYIDTILVHSQRIS